MALRLYQTYTGDSDNKIRDACGEAAVSFVADAAAVACDYTEVVAQVITAMHTKWRGLDLRPHSAAAATLEAMSTMLCGCSRRRMAPRGLCRRSAAATADAAIPMRPHRRTQQSPMQPTCSTLLAPPLHMKPLQRAAVCRLGRCAPTTARLFPYGQHPCVSVSICGR